MSPSICFVANDLEYLVKTGGIGTHNWHGAHTLAYAGWRVHILFCAPIEDRTALPQVRQSLRDRGIAFSLLDEHPYAPELDLMAFSNPPGVVHSDRVRYALEALHRQAPFDLIEFAEWGGTGFRAVQAHGVGGAMESARLAVRLHSSSQWVREGNLRWPQSPEEIRGDFLERYSFDHADVQLSPSRYMFAFARDRGWSVRDDAPVIPYAFPPPAAGPVSIEPGLPELVFFGRLETRKGLEVFVEAARGLPAEVPITFLGKDWWVQATGENGSAYVRRELAGRDVTVMSDLNRADALAYLRSGTRVAVMPSLADNLPFTVIEAAVEGIPFLASNVGGIPEIIEADTTLGTDVLFDPSPRALGAALQHYIARSASERQELVHRAVAATEVTANHAAFVAAYESLVPRPTAAAGVGSGRRPRVTIGVPHYNLGRTLPATLESLARQTYQPIEVVVVDDGSTDDASVGVLAEMERRFPTFRFVRQANGGIGAARNRALAEASGELFIPVDADNVAKPTMVERFVDAMERRPEVAALTSYFTAFEDHRDPSVGPYVYAYRPTGGPHALAAFENVYGDANAVFRTEALRGVGGYELDRDTSFEDWEAFVKLVHAGHRVDVLPEYLYYYRHLEGGFSRVTTRYRNHLRVLRRFFDDGAALPLAERIAVWTLYVGARLDEPGHAGSAPDGDLRELLYRGNAWLTERPRLRRAVTRSASLAARAMRRRG